MTRLLLRRTPANRIQNMNYMWCHGIILQKPRPRHLVVSPRSVLASSGHKQLKTSISTVALSRNLLGVIFAHGNWSWCGTQLLSGISALPAWVLKLVLKSPVFHPDESATRLPNTSLTAFDLRLSRLGNSDLILVFGPRLVRGFTTAFRTGLCTRQH